MDLTKGSLASFVSVQVKTANILVCLGGMQGVLYGILKGNGTGKWVISLLAQPRRCIPCCIYENLPGGVDGDTHGRASYLLIVGKTYRQLIKNIKNK